MHVKILDVSRLYVRYIGISVPGPSRSMQRTTYINESLFLSTRVVYKTFVLVNRLNRGRDLSDNLNEVPINGSVGVRSPNTRRGSLDLALDSTDRDGGGGDPAGLGLASPLSE